MPTRKHIIENGGKPRARGGAEKLEPRTACTAGGSETRRRHRKSLAVHQHLNSELSHDLAIPPLDVGHLKEPKMSAEINTHTGVFTAAQPNGRNHANVYPRRNGETERVYPHNGVSLRHKKK